MRATTILGIISGAGALSIRAECPTSSGSACGIVEALGQKVGYPKCDCKTTCSGPAKFAGINAVVSIGVQSTMCVPSMTMSRVTAVNGLSVVVSPIQLDFCTNYEEDAPRGVVICVDSCNVHEEG
ncbi:hypothetical protein MY3296_009117 [Beauveria thailandica]